MTAIDQLDEAAVAETARLSAVRRYDVLDTPGDGAFDRITALAARVFRVPIAIVSIVDEDQIWFKSRHGVDLAAVPRTPGLCASAILQDDPYVLADATLNPAALSNPLVAGELGLRFYAGVPLATADGYNLGTLCIIDVEPRQLTSAELASLEDMAALVVDELELRLAARQTVAQEAELRMSAESAWLNAESLAESLQSTLLPPRLPTIPGVHVGARYRPADRAQVGGDFYDLFPLPRGAWGIVVGDVCGKGPRAAALTARARHALRAAAIDHDRPRDVLKIVNETLLLDDDGSDNSFCTLVYARLRPHGPDAFQLTVASGGHPKPRLLRRDAALYEVGGSGSLVGCFADAAFTDETTRLYPGDAVVFFTDGLTEAALGTGFLGEEGLDALLSTAGEKSIWTTIDLLEQAATGGDQRQRDDVAIVGLKMMERTP